MPQGWDLGVPWGFGGPNTFFPQIQPDLVCELLTSMAHATEQLFGSPTPGALGWDQKVKYHLISITKSILKVFKLNFVCLLTTERYKIILDGIFIRSPGSCMPQGLGLRGAGGSKV